MNQRYILLSSTYRNRSQYPNPFHFTTSSTSSRSTRTNARDWVSDNAPILNYDLEDYFSAVDGFTAPYRWILTGTITSPGANLTTDTYIINPAATINSVDPVDGQYVGLEFTSSSLAEDGIIQSFVDNKDGTYTVVLDRSIAFTEGGVDTFTIQTVPLELDETYLPIPVSNQIVQENAYVGYYLAEVQEDVIYQITDYDDTTRILTLSGNYTLNAVGPIRPSQFALTKNSILVQYTVQSVTAASNQLTVNASDNPEIQVDNLIGQYIAQYDLGVYYKIVNATLAAGVITLTFLSSADLSVISVSDEIGILFFSYENNKSMDYIEPTRETQWNDRGQVQIYNMQLLSMQIPNKVFANHPGGYPINYPYFFVDIINRDTMERNDNTLYSNNPNLNRATFVCPVLDISTPAFSSFTKLDGSGMYVPFSIKSHDTLEVVVRTPDGNIVQLAESDTLPPTAPNENLQVSLLLEVDLPPSGPDCRYNGNQPQPQPQPQRLGRGQYIDPAFAYL